MGQANMLFTGLCLSPAPAPLKGSTNSSQWMRKDKVINSDLGIKSGILSCVHFFSKIFHVCLVWAGWWWYVREYLIKWTKASYLSCILKIGEILMDWKTVKTQKERCKHPWGHGKSPVSITCSDFWKRSLEPYGQLEFGKASKELCRFLGKDHYHCHFWFWNIFLV